MIDIPSPARRERERPARQGGRVRASPRHHPHPDPLPPGGRGGDGEAGYTLVELLVVLAILGLLVAIAAPRLIHYLGGAKADTARIQVERLGGVLDLYRLEVGRYPSTQEGLLALVERPAQAEHWNGPYLKNRDALNDPWGQPYVYKFPGDHGDYDLYSLGADGKPGGEGENADAKNW